jgi:hypothetical protein
MGHMLAASNCSHSPSGAGGLRGHLTCSARKERVDKVLTNLAYCSRSQAGKFLRQHAVTVEGVRIPTASQRVRLLPPRTEDVNKRCQTNSSYMFFIFRWILTK